MHEFNNGVIPHDFNDCMRPTIEEMLNLRIRVPLEMDDNQKVESIPLDNVSDSIMPLAINEEHVITLK